MVRAWQNTPDVLPQKTTVQKILTGYLFRVTAVKMLMRLMCNIGTLRSFCLSPNYFLEPKYIIQSWDKYTIRPTCQKESTRKKTHGSTEILPFRWPPWPMAVPNHLRGGRLREAPSGEAPLGLPRNLTYHICLENLGKYIFFRQLWKLTWF